MKEKKNIEELKEELAVCQRKQEEYLAGWQRAKADYLNYKKEEAERAEGILKYAGEVLALNLLPILDNFEISEKKLPENLKKDENIKGILQVKKQILDLLNNQGIKEIKTKGEKFDPNFHEAVEEVEKKGTNSGIILEEIKKGYTIHGRVLRPAKVKINK